MTPDRLCELYAERVCRFAAVAAGRDADPEEIAQDSLLKAIRSLHRYDPTRGPLDAWLWRIVRNTARDATRRARIRLLLADRLGRGIPEVSVEDLAVERASVAEVYAAASRLSPRDRELIALRFGSDLPTAEVGALVGLSAESARRAIGRALKRLRALLIGGVE